MTDIEALLEKYYNGETTLDEERQIHEYFGRHPELSKTPDAQLFGATAAAKADEPKASPVQQSRKRLPYLAIGGSAIAAGIALLLILRLTAPIDPQHSAATGPAPQSISAALLVSPKVSGEIQDEQQALEQARKALTYVSRKLNKGINGINQFNKLEQSLSKIQNKEKS